MIPTNIEEYLDRLHELPPEEQRDILSILDRLDTATSRKTAKISFLDFVKKVWPQFVEGYHHKIMAEAFERVARGELKRLIINMAPRHTKSEFASHLFPAWFLGQYPDKYVIQASNTADLAVDFGRKVRDTIGDPAFQEVFPDVAIHPDAAAAGKWKTTAKGEYFAIGTGGTLTGRGGDLIILDDPHSEQEAKQAETKPEIYDSVFEWYTSGPRQRVQPGAAIVIVMCMTGDTNVLMADGVEKQLRHLRAGDEVATYDKGALTTSKVNNWRSSGVDFVYTIQTQSGNILRANGRHPFLVEKNGVCEWKRLKELRPGMALVSLRDVIGPQGQKPSPVSVVHARQKRVTTKKIHRHPTVRWDTTVSIREKLARWAGAISPLTRMKCVNRTTTVLLGLLVNIRKLLPKTGRDGLSIGTASLLMTMIEWLRSKAENALCAETLLPLPTLAHIGMENYVLTIATPLERSGASFATTAILPLDTQSQKKQHWQSQNTSGFTLDRIVGIRPDGEEEVFDVEVDRTENFIANGVVSHNTRWSKRDLTGRVLKAAAEKDGDEWEVIELPAILPSGKPIWPEYWPEKEILAIKDELPIPKWMAQYQQRPTAEEGALIKREWWQRWPHRQTPHVEFIIQSWDTAFLKTERSDYSACTTWGVFLHEHEETGNMMPNLILLDAFRKRMEFPELKKTAFEMYKQWEPEAFVVEKRASGAPLIFELREMGIPVGEFTPSRGNDKIARVNAVSDLFASGVVWAPEHRWADEVIEEFAEFPAGEHDDYVDSSTQALLRYRQGGFVQTLQDEEEEDVQILPLPKYEYY